MRKTQLFKRVGVFAIIMCVSTQLLLYPIIPVSAGGALDDDKHISDEVQSSIYLADDRVKNAAYGYYDTGYNAPIIEEPQYLGLNQTIQLPSSYSSRAEGYVTDVKNQGGLGTCWAFGPIAAMESYALRHGLVDSPLDIDLSEYALASFTFDDSTYTSETGTAASDKTETSDIQNCMHNGGNDQYVFKTLTKWAGIMNESDYPYIFSGTEESVYDASKVSYVLTNQYFINMNNVWHVKNAIMENGAVVGHYNADDEYDVDEWYKEYHYTYKEVGTNHAVAIVGWDDTIAASNFMVVDGEGQEHMPDGPGGWLIKNSWGTSYGDGGYMWVSYYDKSLKDTTCAVYQIAPRSEYDYNYQHDGATVMGHNVNFRVSTYSNVYTVTGDSKQAIKAVSFAIEDVDRDYSIQIYKNPIEDKPESGTAMLTEPVSGTVMYAGYNTVSLPTMIELEPNDTFSVVIEFDQNTRIVTGKGGSTPIGGGGYATSTSVCGDNQSYFKYYGTYYDIYENYTGTYGVNFCIKAMLVDVDEHIEATAITSIEKNGNTGFVIGWQAIKNDITYELLRATDMNGEYEIIYSGKNTTYVDTDVEQYTRYYYKVRVYDNQTPLYSTVRSAYIGIEATKILNITSERDGINIKWSQVVGVDGYNIYRSLDGIDYTLVDTVNDVYTYIDKNVEYGKRYYYKINAFVNVQDSSGTKSIESVASIVSVIMRDITSPSYIDAYEEAHGKIKLTWNTVGDVDGYKLYRSYKATDGSYVQFEEIADVNGTTHTYVADILDVQPGQDVYFYVRAYMNISGEKYTSDYSYTYIYYAYAAIQNIKWYVSNGVLNVKWDEYTAPGITITGYTAIIYNDLAGTNMASSVVSTVPNFAKASLISTNTYYLYVQAKNAMQTAFTPKQNPLVRIGGAWGEFAFEDIADVSCTVGETVTLEANLTYELENFDYGYQWYKTSSKDGVGSGSAISGATSSTYIVTVADYGSAYYYCVCTGEYNGTKTATTNVASVSTIKSISGATVSSIGDQTYTGSEIKPSVTVKDGNKTLVNGTDYTISYSNNVNAGTATVTITGKGNYSGTKSVTFTIVSKAISGATVSSIGDQTYTGNEIKPSVTVKDGSKTLVNGTDYTISYSNNVNAGTATVTITGKGNYSGTKSVTFTIVSKVISGATVSSIVEQTYTGSEIKPSVTVKDGSKTLVNGTDYTISYSNNVNAGTATVTITGKGNYSGTKSTTFTIVAKVPVKVVPDKLTSFKVSVDQNSKKISKITAGTTVSNLLSTIDQKEYAAVYSGNSVVSGDKKLATGMKLCIIDNGKVTKTYTIIVTGDTNGDGKINITDMIAVKAHILKKTILSGVNGDAGDVNGDGKINITDFIKIKAALLGKDSISGVIVN